MERQDAGDWQTLFARVKGPLFVLFGLGAGLALGLLIYFEWFVSDGDSRRLPPSVGATAEDFRLEQLHGSTLRLEDLRGRPVLINFWATWCQPCREEMPLFEHAAKAYGERLVIVGVNYAEDGQTVSRFVNEIGVTFPIVLDEGGDVNRLYFVRSYPSSFFIDADGVIRALHLGAMDEDQLLAYLETIGISP